MKKGLVPELRFPEFENSESWNNEPLEDIYEFKVTNSLSRDKLNYDAGTVKNIHYGDIHTKFSTLFYIEKELVPYINATEPLGKIKKDCYCTEGDMVFADASEDLDDVGKSIEVVNLNNEKFDLIDHDQLLIINLLQYRNVLHFQVDASYVHVSFVLLLCHILL